MPFLARLAVVVGIAVVTVAILRLYWSYERQNNDAFSFIGFGTSLLGSKKTATGSRIVTKWIVFFFLPILPVRSLEIAGQKYAYGGVTGSQSTYVAKPLPKFDRFQFWFYGLLGWVVLGFILLVLVGQYLFGA